MCSFWREHFVPGSDPVEYRRKWNAREGITEKMGNRYFSFSSEVEGNIPFFLPTFVLSFVRCSLGGIGHERNSLVCRPLCLHTPPEVHPPAEIKHSPPAAILLSA